MGIKANKKREGGAFTESGGLLDRPEDGRRENPEKKKHKGSEFREFESDESSLGDLRFSRKNRIKEEYTDTDEDYETEDNVEHEKGPGNSYIEGQEFDKKLDYNEDGIAVTPFNMQDDLEEGSIDNAGYFVRKKDKNSICDSWLYGTTVEDIEKAKRSQEKINRRVQEQDMLRGDTQLESVDNIWLKILSCLKPTETAPAALRRLTKYSQKKKFTPKWKKRDLMDYEEQNSSKSKEETEEEIKSREKVVEMLTVCTNKLTELGDYDSFELTYEQIVRKLRLNGSIPDTWVPGDPVMYN